MINPNYKVNNYELDECQMKLIHSKNNCIVIAGAGAGKTLTILGKINYLIENQRLNPKEILVISFTNASVNDIKSKLKYSVNTFTFHKLAMIILDFNNFKYTICNSNLLNYIIREFLHTANLKVQKIILKYLKIKLNYSQFLDSVYFKHFCQFIESFINFWKTNHLHFQNINLSNFYNIEKEILILIFNIYKIYLEEKNSNGQLDFDDLIIYASQLNCNLNYKYIIIDEFQDTSTIRINLIQKIYFDNNSKIIVVGDDWQSIYRFSGCNIELFLNFEKLFPSVETIKLINTYRNSQELIDIASSFILKNPYQLSKNLISKKHTQIPIIFMPSKNKIKSLKKILNTLIHHSNDIMILMRNNEDIHNYIDNDFNLSIDFIEYKNHKIKLFTVHKSKGLESDYVIIINVNNDFLGFPNKIQNNSLIEKIDSHKEMKYAEERRLFYVALTRARKQTILIYNKSNPSTFIKELQKIVKNRLGKITYIK